VRGEAQVPLRHAVGVVVVVDQRGVFVRAGNLADAERIDQALTNYLTNAFKYTPANQPVLVKLTTEGCMARVAVSDRGPGLTTEQQQRVWERFYQVETGLTREVSGLGVGLTICSHLIALQRGKIWAESQEQQGSTFRVWLPCYEPVSIA